MVKKSRVIFLLALSLLLLLSGCRTTDETTADGRIRLTYWVFFGGGDLEFMEQIVDEFNTSQNEIYVDLVLQDFDEYYTKLVTSVAANRGPDIAVSHTTSLPELVNQGLTLPLDEIAAEVGLDFSDYNENIMSSAVIDGSTYALPIDTHPFIWYINTDLADEAGLLDEDGQPILEETPEGFIDFFHRAKEALPDKNPLAISTGGLDPYRWWWMVYFQKGGGPIFTGDMRSPDITLDRDIAIEAVEYIHRFYHDEKIIPLHIADFYQDFQSGKAVTTMTGVWATGIWETTDDFNFLALPIPQLFENEAVFGNSHTLFLPIKEERDPERERAAGEFLKFAGEQGAIWAQAGHIPTNKGVVESEEFLSMPQRPNYVEVADQVVFPDKSIYYKAAETEMVRALDEILAGRLSPEAGIDKMIHDLEVIIR